MSSSESFAIVGVAKNEAPYLAEWIAAHSAVGFDRIVLYDNGSTDETRQIVESAAKFVRVELVDWPSREVRYQADAYEDAVVKFGHDHSWMAFLDLDEFLVPSGGLRLETILERCRSSAGVAVNWQVYGSSGHELRPTATVTESFQFKATRGFPPNLHTKSVVKTKYFRRCINPHFMELSGGYADANGNEIAWESPGITKTVSAIEKLRVNHYFTKSRSEWSEKCARGHRGASRTAEEFEAYDRNEVHDPCAVSLGALARAQPFVTNPPPKTLPTMKPKLPLDFVPKKYLKLNVDVAQSGVDAIDHYILFGHAEGRHYK